MGGKESYKVVVPGSVHALARPSLNRHPSTPSHTLTFCTPLQLQHRRVRTCFDRPGGPNLDAKDCDHLHMIYK